MSYQYRDRAYRRSRTTRPSPYHEAGGSDCRNDRDSHLSLPRRAIYLEQSPSDFDIGDVDDWTRICYSDLAAEDFSPLLFAAGFSVWTDEAGSLRLCDADGTLRAELFAPRAYNGRRAPATIFDNDDRKISPFAATRTELMELLMLSHIRLYENSFGDLDLRERARRVLGVLRRP
jgi:hypothetical protein